MIHTEEEAKVVAVVWGTELIQFLAALSILHQDDLKNSMQSSYSSTCPGANHPFLQLVLVKNSKRVKELINSVPQTAMTTFALSSV